VCCFLRLVYQMYVPGRSLLEEEVVVVEEQRKRRGGRRRRKDDDDGEKGNEWSGASLALFGCTVVSNCAVWVKYKYQRLKIVGYRVERWTKTSKNQGIIR